MATNPIHKDAQAASRDILEKKFAQIGPGVSPAARAVLEAALAETPKQPLFELLASMPNVGEDSDFERHRR